MKRRQIQVDPRRWKSKKGKGKNPFVKEYIEKNKNSYIELH